MIIFLLAGNQRQDKQGSFAIREGGTVNLDVTSPGATVALGLVYLRTGAAAPAAWLRPPTTPYELDAVRPDLLMLRIIARGNCIKESMDRVAGFRAILHHYDNTLIYTQYNYDVCQYIWSKK